MLLKPFIPVFVAVDAFGVLPIFISLTEVSSLLLAAKYLCPLKNQKGGKKDGI